MLGNIARWLVVIVTDCCFLVIQLLSDLISDEDVGGSFLDDIAGTRTVEVLTTPGETVVLPCDPNSPTIRWHNASVKWYRDNEAVDPGARYSWGGHRHHRNKTTDNKPGRHDLHIQHVNRQDSGVWQCRLEGQRKKEDLVSHPIRLIIACKSSFSILGIYIVILR